MRTQSVQSVPPAAVSAIICTRTESEVEEVFDSLSDIGGIEFYSFNTIGQLLRHMLLKASRDWGTQ